MKVHGTLSRDGVISFFLRFWQQYRNDAARGLVPSSSVLRQDTESEPLSDTSADESRRDGRTALHLAASRGDLADVVQLLHERKEGRLDLDINQLDTHGWTALHCACEGGHLEVCDILLQNGADPSIPTNDGNLALHYVASRPPLAQSQLKSSVMYDYPDDDDDQGENENGDEGSNEHLMKKAEEIDEEDPLYIKVLLRMLTGVNVNTRNYQGETALHKAVLRGSRGAVDMLIKCSHVDVNSCNQYGETPLFYAIRRNAPEIVRTLLWYGADKDFVGPAGTPTEVAMQMGLDHMVNVLEEAPGLPDSSMLSSPSTSDIINEGAEIEAGRPIHENFTSTTTTTSSDDAQSQKRERRGWGAWRELARKAVGSTGLGSLRREKARGVWKVFITSYTGKYLTAKPDGKICLARRATTEGAIVPTSSPLDGAEGQMWLLQRVSKGDDGGENQYALRSSYGKYLRAAPDGSLRVEREIVGESEIWTGTDQRLRVLALRSRYSKFLCAHPGGRVRADSENAEEWEEWSIHDADGERGVMRDVYGFVIPGQEVELYERFVARYYNKRVPQQRRDWRKYLASNDLEKEIQNDSPQLKKLIRTVGIPPEKRRKLWYKLSGAEGKATVSARTYADLIKQSQNMQSNIEVERDVARTFPTHSYFREDEARAALTRVLSAYAIWNPSLGYCQSMNFIAGLLLLVTDEEGAFWLLSKIVEDMLVDYFTPSMLGLLVDQQVLAALVRARMPAVYSHLSMLGVPVHSFTTKWLMCMFADSAPTETVLRIWDFIFTDGSHILFLLVYALFKTHQTTILRLNTAQEIVNLFRQTLRETYEPDSWFKVAFESQRDALLTPNNLSSMRQTYLASILQEQKLHSKKKDIFVLQQQTSFSVDELESLHNEYDTLTAASLRNRLELYDFPFVLQSLSPNWSKVTYSRTRALFELFDKDGDGILSFHELALGLSPLLKGPLDPLLQTFFKLFGQKAPQAAESAETETGEESAADDEASGDRAESGRSSIAGSADQEADSAMLSPVQNTIHNEREAKEIEDNAVSRRSIVMTKSKAREAVSVVCIMPDGEVGDHEEDNGEPKEKDRHGDLDEIDSEFEDDKRKLRRSRESALIIGAKRFARSISGSSSSSVTSYSGSASSYERRREERERLEEGADLVISGDDMTELIATLRLVYGPVLVGFSVGSGDSLITNDLFLRQEKDRIQQKLRSALAAEGCAVEVAPQPKLFTWRQFKETMYDHHADLIFLITEYISESSNRKLHFKG